MYAYVDVDINIDCCWLPMRTRLDPDAVLFPPAGVTGVSSAAAASAVAEALTCGCQAGTATAQALAQAIAQAGGCDCNGISQTLAGGPAYFASKQGHGHKFSEVFSSW
jgi:hypothetical protein